jgi:hypothetical protein
MYHLIRVSISLVLLVLLVGLNACDDEAESLLQRAEQQLFSNPDSAQTLLDSIATDQLGDEQRARYGLLRTYASDLATREINSDTLLRDSYIYYKEKSDDGETDDSLLLRRFSQCAYFMGRYYQVVDSTKQSEDLYRQAIRLSERCNDHRTAYLAYDYLSRIILWSNTHEALKLLFSATG